MRVVPIPVLTDNYAYLVLDRKNAAVLIDPAEPDKVLWRVKEQRGELEAVLTTHAHRDHAGGNKRLAQLLPELEIVGGSKEGVPACTRGVSHGEELRVGQLVITCLETPYHTTGHMCYLVREEGCEGPAAAFTGDVLFVGGCGRRFRGTPKEMFASLSMLAALDPDTLVYCGHEYTVGNLEFAVTVDGANPAVLRKLEWARQQREKGLPTVPSTIGGELQHNVFLRCHEPAIQRHCNTHPQSSDSPLRAAAGAQEGASRSAESHGGPGGAQASSSGPTGKQNRGDGFHEATIRTLAELRSRKDNFGLGSMLITAAVSVAYWLGLGP